MSTPHMQAGYIRQWLHPTDRERELRSGSVTVVRGPDIDPGLEVEAAEVSIVGSLVFFFQ